MSVFLVQLDSYRQPLSTNFLNFIQAFVQYARWAAIVEGIFFN